MVMMHTTDVIIKDLGVINFCCKVVPLAVLN